MTRTLQHVDIGAAQPPPDRAGLGARSPGAGARPRGSAVLHAEPSSGQAPVLRKDPDDVAGLPKVAQLADDDVLLDLEAFRERSR